MLYFNLPPLESNRITYLYARSKADDKLKETPGLMQAIHGKMACDNNLQSQNQGGKPPVYSKSSRPMRINNALKMLIQIGDRLMNTSKPHNSRNQRIDWHV